MAKLTLDEALTMRLRQARLVNWRMSKRRMIERNGQAWQLMLGWHDDSGWAPPDPDDPEIDTTDMPAGVSCSVWSAPPDTIDAIQPPSEADIKTAAARLGCRYVDRGDMGDGRVVYYMVV